MRRIYQSALRSAAFLARGSRRHERFASVRWRSSIARHSFDARDREAFEGFEYEEFTADGAGHPGSEDAASEPSAGADDSSAGRREPDFTIRDGELTALDVSSLPKRQLLYCMGRSSALRLDGEGLWKGYQDRLAALLDEMTSEDVTKVLQNLAYAKARLRVGVDSDVLTALLRHVARHIRDYDNEGLTRLLYSYAKGQWDRPKFLDFLVSEVVDRLKTFAPRQLTRLLVAAANLPSPDESFLTVLAKKAMDEFYTLPAEGIGELIPILVRLHMHMEPSYILKVNAVLKKRVCWWSNPALIVQAVYPAVLNDICATATLKLIFNRFLSLRVPLTYPPAPTGDHSADDAASSEERRIAWSEYGREVARVNEYLVPLKIMEMWLRHDNQEALSLFSPHTLHFLERIRSNTVQYVDKFNVPEQPFVLQELANVTETLGFHFVPAIYGPYLLKLTDPRGRLLVEWDRNWELYPPYRREYHRDFTMRKHRYLTAEGWTVIKVPLDAFRVLETQDEKNRMVARFLLQYDLAHMRLPAAHEDTHADGASGETGHSSGDGSVTDPSVFVLECTEGYGQAARP
ncbi:unnamed protein product [Vitrella brassicaformis CCMP3155]|uniref:RAP domain-containing protein n=3 Tax=Vitrella brassicaformis TaxID=1169539 RepID=A0A0G4EDM8_VITBC|nr:unnamed protein product [Vitrella brassicaformis CCMP3155]|eukprot:CEL93475.1 unnamed protein product [Vitrella brassicaformis CCMP3155]